LSRAWSAIQSIRWPEPFSTHRATLGSIWLRVAEIMNHANEDHEIIAVGRLTRIQGTRDAEVAVLVTDQYQHGGLGAELLARLIQVARVEKLNRIVATILLENMAMRALVSRCGFQIQGTADLGVVEAVLRLS